MEDRVKGKAAVVFVVTIGMGPVVSAAGPQAQIADAPPTPKVKVVTLDPGDKPYLRLLGGPPDTASMRAGLVTLAPGTSVGKHSTGKNEEMLVPLEGEGELRITGQPSIPIKPGLITYAPAHTEHDVTNTGTARLRYIFVVARAE